MDTEQLSWEQTRVPEDAQASGHLQQKAHVRDSSEPQRVLRGQRADPLHWPGLQSIVWMWQLMGPEVQA